MIDHEAITEWTARNAYARSSYLGHMAPEDPRHGTVAGYSQHIRSRVEPCEPCRRAQMRYSKGWKLRNLDGARATRPAIGSQRRVRALMRIGWSTNQIADRSGIGMGTVSRIANGTTPRLSRAVADAVAALFEELSLTHGPADVVARRAAARGWAPPLAWDDIDNPDEKPQGVRRRAS